MALAAMSGPSPTARAQIWVRMPSALPTTVSSASRRPDDSARPIVNSTLGPGIAMMTTDAAANASRVEADGIPPSVRARASRPHRFTRGAGQARALHRLVGPRAPRRGARITGVARMPCTSTESATVKPTVDHSHRSSGNDAAPAAYAT